LQYVGFVCGLASWNVLRQLGVRSLISDGVKLKRLSFCGSLIQTYRFATQASQCPSNLILIVLRGTTTVFGTYIIVAILTVRATGPRVASLLQRIPCSCIRRRSRHSSEAARRPTSGWSKHISGYIGNLSCVVIPIRAFHWLWVLRICNTMYFRHGRSG
jgi:hypothetical protein